MEKKKSKQITPVGIAVFPSITKEITFDGKGIGKTGTGLKLDPSKPVDAEWVDYIQALENEMIDEYLEKLKVKDKKAYNIQSKWDRRSALQPELDDEGEETGMLVIKFHRKLEKGIATLKDAKRNTLPNTFVVTGGSTIKVAYGTGWVYALGSGKYLGVPFYMNAVQVLALGSMGGTADDFEDEEGFDGSGYEAPTVPEGSQSTEEDEDDF